MTAGEAGQAWAEAAKARTVEIPAQIPAQWLKALERFDHSTRGLQEAYRALQGRVEALDLALQERNRQLEENLGETERLRAHLHHILEGLPVGVMVADLHGRVTLANKVSRELLGLCHGDLAGSLDCILAGLLPPRDLQRLGRPPEGRGSVSLERRVRLPGKESPCLRFCSGPLMDEKGHAAGRLITVEDLSDLRAMEEEVARSQRLAAMGEMAAGIAHEVRNPLGGIQLFVSLMAEEPDARARRGIMDQIQSAIGAVDQILANLLTFSRPLRPNRAPMDPAGLMEECVAFSLPLAQQKGVRLTLGPRSTDVPLEADRILLKQALLNILLNALQATPPGGAVRAWVQGTAPAFKPAQADTGPAPSCPWVELGVQDTGEGIPPDVIPRVTDPFYTTRPGGTGLGLTIVHNIVRSHGGVLGIRSEPGEGTRVEFRIPTTPGGPGEER